MVTRTHPPRTLETSPWNKLGSRLKSALGKRDGLSFETTMHEVLQEGVKQNSLSEEERDMAESVLSLRKVTARELMTPRPRMTALNLQDGEEENWRKVVSSGHWEFPVYDGNLDAILGTVHIKSLWANLALAGSARISDLLKKPQFVSENQSALSLLKHFRQSGRHLALVIDEFGNIEGLVTLMDVLEVIVGELPALEERRESPLRSDGSGGWYADPLIDMESLKKALRIDALPESAQGSFTTLSGLFFHQLHDVPEEGAYIEVAGYRMEIIAMDRHRIDKIRVTKLEPRENESRAHSTAVV